MAQWILSLVVVGSFSLALVRTIGQDYGSGNPQVMIGLPTAAAAATAQVFPAAASASNASTTSTEYQGIIGGDDSGWDVLTDEESVVPTAGVISDFRAHLHASISSGSYLVSIMHEGSISAISCTITSASCTDSDTLTVAAFDEIAIENNPATPSTARRIHWSFNFTPTVADEFILFGSGQTTGATTRYGPVSGDIANLDASVENATNVVCEAGTIGTLHVEYATALGSGDQRTYTVLIDTAPPGGGFVDSDPNVSCTIDGDATAPLDQQCSGTNTFSVAAGDRIVIEQIEDDGSPSTQHHAHSVVFRPTTAGRFMVMGTTHDTTVNDSIRQLPPLSGAGSFAADSSTNVAGRSNAWTVQNIYATAETGPGATGTWRLAFENQTAGTSDPNCQMSGTTSPGACNNTDTRSVSAGDIVNFQTRPTSTPTNTTGMSWCFGGTVP